MIKYFLNWHFLGKVSELGDNKQKFFKTKKNKNNKEIVDPIPGVYVWMLPDEDKKQKKTVYYVGESKNIWKRLEQEIIDLLGGAWLAYRLPKSNFTNFVFNTFYDKKNKKPINENGYCGIKENHYSPNRGQIGCIGALLNKNRIEWAMTMLNVLEIAIAKITTEVDGKEMLIDDNASLKEIEAAIIIGLRKGFKEGEKITDGIPNNIENTLFGGISSYPKNDLNIEHRGDVGSLPDEITKILTYRL